MLSIVNVWILCYQRRVYWTILARLWWWWIELGWVEDINNSSYLHKTAGTKHIAFVSIIPLTASKCGNMAKTKIAVPIVGKDSVTKTIQNSVFVGLVHDLYKIFLSDLKNVPTCGVQYVKKIIQVHKTVCSVVDDTMNRLCGSRTGFISENHPKSSVLNTYALVAVRSLCKIELWRHK